MLTWKKVPVIENSFFAVTKQIITFTLTFTHTHISRLDFKEQVGSHFGCGACAKCSPEPSRSGSARQSASTNDLQGFRSGTGRIRDRRGSIQWMKREENPHRVQWRCPSNSWKAVSEVKKNYWRNQTITDDNEWIWIQMNYPDFRDHESSKDNGAHFSKWMFGVHCNTNGHVKGSNHDPGNLSAFGHTRASNPNCCDEERCVWAVVVGSQEEFVVWGTGSNIKVQAEMIDLKVMTHSELGLGET